MWLLLLRKILSALEIFLELFPIAERSLTSALRDQARAPLYCLPKAAGRLWKLEGFFRGFLEGGGGGGGGGVMDPGIHLREPPPLFITVKLPEASVNSP